MIEGRRSDFVLISPPAKPRARRQTKAQREAFEAGRQQGWIDSSGDKLVMLGVGAISGAITGGLAVWLFVAAH
jgi:hypothetical protein